jgi:hypothetical protein
MSRGKRQQPRAGIIVGNGSGRHRLAPAGPVTVKKLPQEWAAERGSVIMDSDGWRKGDLAFDQPCTLEEFEPRFLMSTIGPLGR